LRAYAYGGGTEAPLLVNKLLTRMEELSMKGFSSVKPDYTCHNVYLGALLGSITRDNLSGRKIVKQAEAYLQHMMASPDEDARPDAWSFNMVISAWSKSGDWEMTERAEALFSQLEAYHKASGYSEKTQPNTNTYNCRIACYSRSTMWDKAKRAHSVLERLKKMNEEGYDSALRPDAVTYNTVMNAYAKSKETNAPQKVEELLQEMHRLYEETGDRSLKPSSRSFNTCVSFQSRCLKSDYLRSHSPHSLMFVAG
jgi:pentatricopeptide repeat protein